MTALALWLALSSPIPDYYGVPGVAMSYDPVLNHWADANLVPRPLARRLVAAESGFKPDGQAYQWQERRGKWHKTTKVLANGVAMVTTNERHLAEHLARAGIDAADYDWRDASDSLRVGMAYLGYLLRYFDYEHRPAVAGYNAGRDRASAWWNDGRALPRETVGYLRKVLR